MPPTPQTPAMVALAKAGRKYARLDAARDTAMAELREAIRVADAEGGHTKSDLVKAAGVARQTVYDALASSPGAPAAESSPEAHETVIGPEDEHGEPTGNP